jgi:signal transduction histidine kinase
MKSGMKFFCLTILVAASYLGAARSNWDQKKKSIDSINQAVQDESDSSITDQINEQDEEPSLEELDDQTVEPRVIVAQEQAPQQPREFSQQVQAKRKKVTNLVRRAIDYIKKHSISDAMNKFTHTKEFIDGELYLYVYDDNGVCFANGQQPDEVWENQINLTDIYGNLIVQEILKKGKHGGGWITYAWRNSTKVAYVQEVKKDGKNYTVGCGYYPHSKEDKVVNLVKGAVTLWNKMKAQKEPVEETFSSLSYSMGRFIYGDLYLYALDFKGNIYAQGDRPGLVGTNSWEYRDSNGKFVNQEIVNKLKAQPEEGVWVEYASKRARKRAYAEQVVDNKGNKYFIACGYYPDENRDMVVDLVKKGYQYMKAHGKSIAAKDFSDRQNDQFRLGDLYLVVYDLKGVCVADGGNVENVGSNRWNFQNENGRYVVREIIAQAKKGGGWVDFRSRNSFQSLYVELVDLGVDTYAIGCGIYPGTKDETVSILVKSASSYLESHANEEAFEAFTHKNSPISFIRGDLSIFVLNKEGLCFASGDDYNLIWQNVINAKDDAGKTYIKTFIDLVKSGPTTFTYSMHKATKIAHLAQVVKDGQSYVVGSSYFL